MVKHQIPQFTKNSNLYKKMQQNTLNIPSDKSVSTNGNPLPFVFVGNEALGLSIHMLRSYVGKISNTKRKFLIIAKQYIEIAFVILTNKWRIFQGIVKERDGVHFENTLNVVGLTDSDSTIHAGCPPSAITIREKFTDYFFSIGSVS